MIAGTQLPKHSEFVHLYDSPLNSGFRFLSEIIAWVAGPWAAGQVRPILGVVVLIVLIGLPSVFLTKGDKRHIVIGTLGPYRVLIDLLQYLVAALAPGTPNPESRTR